MSEKAINSFLPWLRRGVSASIGRTDDSTVGGSHAGFEVQMGFNKDAGGNPSLAESVTISLYGPGEVVGLDRQTVTRTWPEAGSINAEANLFPMIEFDQPDLPWRYTPARAKKEDRLKPWICLIALRNNEIERMEPASPDRLLPAVTVKSAESLPMLDQSGAWAHVHVSGNKVETDKIRDILTAKPHSAVSRLLCPRRLDNLTEYTAFLVPAFERGRLAGLQQPVGEDIDALTGAWSEGTNLRQLPVYYMWSFTTGDLGDFEYLATLLDGYNLGADVGFRKMSVSSPGLGLPDASDQPMDLDGALISNAVDETDAVISRDFVQEIVNKLNLPDDFLSGALSGMIESVVAPPLYGQVYSDSNRLPQPLPDPSKPWIPPTAGKRWFWQINIDPRRRVASGLGTLVIQANEQQLMASAWEQVEAIRRANREIRYAQLSMEISASSYKRNLLTQNTEAAVYLTAPSHSRVVASLASPGNLTARASATAPPPTISFMLRRSAISKGALDPQWRRRSSPLGAIGKRQGRADMDVRLDFLKRMGTGGLAASRPPETPSSMLSFSKAVPPPVITLTKGRGPAGASTLLTSAMDAVLLAFNAVPEDEVLPGFQPEVLDALASGLVKELEPRKNIAGGVKNRLTLTPDMIPPVVVGLSGGPLGGDDEIKPVMRAPEFPQPMYTALRDLSQDWLLPGVEKVPQNSVSLLKANQHFIEAFMVGLNHEMARELLWNGYPTDMRGTYFSQFWDSSGVVSHPPIPPQELKDIDPINLWGDNLLGVNSARELAGGEILVLLVRGELLKRYPNTMVYAAKAKRKDLLPEEGEPQLDIGAEERHPIFGGTLQPDISFFGFDLTEAVAKGTNGDPGWFFVLQEQPSEPRFGLDVATEKTTGKPLTKWREMSWGHLVERAEDLGGIVYIDLNDATRPVIVIDPPEPDEPDERLFKWRDGGSSDIAYITYQPQVRVAILAKVMLP